MNAPLEQLRSMKGRQCAWYIRRDVVQDLHLLETFPCRRYGTPLARGHVLESAHAYLFMSIPIFYTEELVSNLCRGVINMSVESRKRLYFCQITIFLVFFSFAWSLDIWPIND